MFVGVSRGQELELQVVVSHLLWELGIELRSPARAVCARNHSAIYPVLREAMTTIACDK